MMLPRAKHFTPTRRLNWVPGIRRASILDDCTLSMYINYIICSHWDCIYSRVDVVRQVNTCRLKDTTGVILNNFQQIYHIFSLYFPTHYIIIGTYMCDTLGMPFYECYYIKKNVLATFESNKF